MKKASLMAIIFTCFTFAFTLPAAYAAGTPSGNATMTNRDDNTMADRVANGVTSTTRGLANGVNNVTNGVANGVNDVTNGVATGVNRAITGIANGVENGYRTNATTTAARDNDGMDWGWLGLLGLIGLAGMRNKDRNHA